MSRGVRGFSANPRPEPQAEAAREAPTLNLEELEEETFEERCGDDSDVLMMLFDFFLDALRIFLCEAVLPVMLVKQSGAGWQEPWQKQFAGMSLEQFQQLFNSLSQEQKD